MRVAIAQIDTILGDIKKNLSKIEHYTDKAIEEKCDLIVFPELALTGYGLKDLVYSVSVDVKDDLFDPLKDKSGFIDISFGFAQKENGYFYNSAVYLAEGNILAIHKKSHLQIHEEEKYFTAGDSTETFKTKFGNTTMLICEDAFHISSHYEAFKNETDFMIVLSASPFWSDSDNKKWEMWENILKASAQLNGYFVIFANRVGFEDGVGFFGKSFIVNPFGNIVGEASIFKEEMLIVDLDLRETERAKINMPIKKNEALK